MEVLGLGGPLFFNIFFCNDITFYLSFTGCTSGAPEVAAQNISPNTRL
jgi:hypothetical protein